MKETPLTIAIPKGKLLDESVSILKNIGLPVKEIRNDSRKMLIEYPQQKIKYIVCRSADVPTYVEYGASDIGIAGKDIVTEAGRNIFELLDLGFGECKFVLALPRRSIPKYKKHNKYDVKKILSEFPALRVATKFPNISHTYFKSIGLQAEIIHLHGNIELAPLVGMAEAIVDIVSTGRTLKENNLAPIDEISRASARLVANRVSCRLKYSRIKEITDKIEKVLLEGK